MNPKLLRILLEEVGYIFSKKECTKMIEDNKGLFRKFDKEFEELIENMAEKVVENLE